VVRPVALVVLLGVPLPAVGPGVVAAVAAAFAWGGYIFLLKRLFDGHPATVVVVGLNAAAVVWYLPVTALAVRRDGPPDLGAVGPGGVALVALTIVAVAAGIVVFLRAIDEGEVSYVTPINKLVPVFVLPIELAFLEAHLTPVQLVGVVVATLAVYVANYRAGSLFEPLRRAVTTRPAQLALVSAVCYAVGDVGKRVALQELGLPTAVWVPTLLGGVLVVLAPLAAREWDLTRGDVPKFAGVGLLVATAEHLTSLAFGAIPASVASPIVNTQAIVAVVLGGLVLRESSFGLRLVAAALAVTGVTLVAL
jgi:drug/metabolite transporter (DMT)-like permease